MWILTKRQGNGVTRTLAGSIDKNKVFRHWQTEIEPNLDVKTSTGIVRHQRGRHQSPTYSVTVETNSGYTDVYYIEFIPWLDVKEGTPVTIDKLPPLREIVRMLEAGMQSDTDLTSQVQLTLRYVKRLLKKNQ